MDKFDELLPALNFAELQDLASRVEARRIALAELPPRTLQNLEEQRIRLRPPGDARMSVGTVLYSTPSCLVLKTGNLDATIHHFRRPMPVVPRGEPLELIHEGRGHYRMSRRRGEAWEALRRDRKDILDALIRGGKGVERALGGISPEDAMLLVPQVGSNHYKGPIVAETSEHIMQVEQNGQVRVHNKSDFPRLPLVGPRAVILYEDGVAAVRQNRSHARARA